MLEAGGHEPQQGVATVVMPMRHARPALLLAALFLLALAACSSSTSHPPAPPVASTQAPTGTSPTATSRPTSSPPPSGGTTPAMGVNAGGGGGACGSNNDLGQYEYALGFGQEYMAGRPGGADILADNGVSSVWLSDGFTAVKPTPDPSQGKNRLGQPPTLTPISRGLNRGLVAKRISHLQ
jgi:hypothetical protein